MKKIILMTMACAMCWCHIQAQTLRIDGSNYENYLEQYTTTESVTTNFTVLDHQDLRNAKKIIIANSIPDEYRIFTYRDNDFETDPSSTVLANLEELELEEGHPIWSIRIHGTSLKKVIINNGIREFHTLNIQFSYLTQDDIILGSEVKPRSITLHRNLITDLEPIYSMMSDSQNSFEINGGKYVRSRYAGVDDGETNPSNLIREIEMNRIPATLKNFTMRYNLLDRLENVNHPNISTLLLNNNILWSADLSSITETPSSNYIISPQKPVADLMVEKGNAVDGSQDEVRLYLPEGQSELFNNDRLVDGSVKLLGTTVATQAIQGTSTEKYFKVASVADGQKADLDLYSKHNGFSYQYNTSPALTDAEKRDMSVEVKTYPYIMYINPATKSGTGVNYYSGTLWLDYDAIVPDETEVFIATAINKEAVTTGGTAQAADQLTLEPIGGPGALIPAGTAMYVRSNTKAGLYAFQKAWTHELIGWDGTGSTTSTRDTLWYNRVYTPEQEAELAAQKAKIAEKGNLLEGYPTAKTLPGKRQALVLGIEDQKGTKMIGFWPYNGTTIPAHRAYISEETYRRVTGNTTAKGVTFFFNNLELTDIKSIDDEQNAMNRDGWYTLDGRRLAGKPTQKGIYINKGRKEVIR